jgi:hypothetical protein
LIYLLLLSAGPTFGISQVHRVRAWALRRPSYCPRVLPRLLRAGPADAYCNCCISQQPNKKTRSYCAPGSRFL